MRRHFFEWFKRVLEDEAYVERLKRQYGLFKEAIRQRREKNKAKKTLRKRRPPSGRDDKHMAEATPEFKRQLREAFDAIRVGQRFIIIINIRRTTCGSD